MTIPTSASELERLILRTWDFNDPAASARSFAELAETATEQGNPRAGVVLRTQQARAIGLAGDFADAATLLDSLAPTGDHDAARIAVERGRVLNSTGDPAAALPLFVEAETRSRAAGLPGLAIDAMHMQAIALGTAGDAAGSERVVRAALEEATASSDPAANRWRASLLNNLGWTLADTGRWEPSLEVFEEAVRERIASGTRILEARWAQARALRALGRIDEALAIQLELTAEDPADSYVHAELAELYESSGDPEAAARHRERANP